MFDRHARMVAALMTLLMPGAGPPATTIASLLSTTTADSTAAPLARRAPSPNEEGDHRGREGGGEGDDAATCLASPHALDVGCLGPNSRFARACGPVVARRV